MLLWLILGAAGIGLAVLALRWFATVPTGDLMKALRTFVAVFGTLASTGLLFMGRFGFGVVLLGAVFMAIRGMWLARRPPDAFPGQSDEPASTVTTDLLEMRLDHGTVTLEGRVRSGPLAGRTLASMSMNELVGLHHEAEQRDVRSVPLVEAYLDRRFPDWRTQGFEQSQSQSQSQSSRAEGDVMDEKTALGILGLSLGADEAAIRAAHRRLLSRLHPDHGGSDWLAARINGARDYLLKPRRRSQAQE